MSSAAPRSPWLPPADPDEGRLWLSWLVRLRWLALFAQGVTLGFVFNLLDGLPAYITVARVAEQLGHRAHPMVRAYVGFGRALYEARTQRLTTARATARRWGVGASTVRAWCAQGKIRGAIRVAGQWQIPADVPCPAIGPGGRRTHQTR